MAPSEQVPSVGLRGYRGRARYPAAPSRTSPATRRRATFPLDLTKTRLQMQGEAALARLGDSARESAPYRGMVRTALGIVQEEGFLKLWQGVTPAIYRHIVYSGGRMVTYEHLREVVFGKSEDKHYPLWKSVIGGMMAGVVGQFLANPTDLVKVQMQMEGKRKLEGKPLRFRGVHHAFAKILSEGGIRGLWAGWVPNIQRAALVNMGDLTTYDTVKHYLVLNTPLEDNIMTHGLSSLCSGLVASILGTPADVIKSRIMNQPRDKQGRGLLYKSSTDCLVQAVQGEGFMSLYKGFLPSWLRMKGERFLQTDLYTTCSPNLRQWAFLHGWIQLWVEAVPVSIGKLKKLRPKKDLGVNQTIYYGHR
ncbi:mitochondrial uncoupling protein 4 isoform X2 [Canis lupus baileyi]|uniref:mitochondrial uncoupling protein 4 isoform X2 n=1 Tax=Canis lupus dingo TaxID=286419 RepID=UPI0003AE783D|nr:mitochondrial uncoupling protein 4 isoform X2 [Canis lupus dingo]XP_038538700.1 mitochondrial uncoupling protein 4 isoform X2 [Canis lupus familiaris]|eukprot:XP_005627482.1 mitochondrial uncoupling protein 4 isoform X2 [Canis lupus familiaris]